MNLKTWITLRRAIWAAGLLAVGCWNGQAMGQSVITGGPGAWAVSVAPPGPSLPGGLFPGTQTGSVSMAASAVNFGGFADLVQLSLRGTVENTPLDATPADAFRFQLSQEQTFILGEEAWVALPTYLRGELTLGVHAMANITSVAAIVALYDISGPTPTSMLSLSYSRSRFGFTDGVGTTLVEEFLFDQVLLSAGTYKVRTSLELAGGGGSISSLPGATATADFFSTPRRGLVTSVAAYKGGLDSSRDAVRAPEARMPVIMGGFGVDGTGVEVGLVENGRPYETHSALAGKLTVEIGPGGGDYRTEHALVTSSIIAGADADAANAGIAPGATIRSASIADHSGNFDDAINALLAANPSMKIINMSFTTGAAGAAALADEATIDTFINNNPSLTFVKSAGNAGTAGSISAPGRAENIITVGAVTRDFTRRAAFSSYGGAAGVPMKPDLVAPGEYINAAISGDTDGDAMINDFLPIFLGEAYHRTIAQASGSGQTGDSSGTSFSTPHVTGAAALLHQYQDLHPAHHEEDHRVIKAVLLNSAATTNLFRAGGAAWNQTTTGSLPGMIISRSLDQELGAGMLDVYGALRQYEPDEIRDADSIFGSNLNIDTAGRPIWWDLQDVLGTGSVSYLLGHADASHLRATLTWDDDVMGGTGLMPLELELWADAEDPLNPLGPDAADLLIARTSAAGENVKLIDLTLLIPGEDWNAKTFYLKVINGGATTTPYGIAVIIPEPSTLLLALLTGSLGIGIRRRK